VIQAGAEEFVASQEKYDAISGGFESADKNLLKA
jgi:hypothetical protein